MPAETSPGSGALLEPSFLNQLEALRRKLEARARSGSPGEHAARRHGSSAEFQEHRAYEPGDDLRRVDWLAFARKGAPVVKLFRAEEDVIVRLLLDASASLAFGEPAKFDVARRLAAAIGYMSLRGSQRAQVRLGSARARAGRSLASVGTPRRGRGGIPALFKELSDAEPGGKLDLAAAIDETVARADRPGLLVVLSDFFDPGPTTAALSRARAGRHDVALVQVLSPMEIDPPYEGDYALEDSETGAALEVTLDAAALEAYARRLNALYEELRAFARKYGASYLRVLTSDPLEAAVRRFVARGVD